MADIVLTPEKRREFLNELRQIPNVVRACRKVDISRARAYEVREADAEFGAQWDAAIAEGVESMEAEAQRRAFEGYPGRPVVHQGAVVTEITEYSDTLAIFLLKAHAPEKYREKSSMELTGANGAPLHPGGDMATELAEILTAARGRRDADASDLV